MLKGFRDFILKGNVMDLAVAVIIGGAFGAIVTSLTTNIIMPFIGAVVGKPSFDDLAFTLHGGNIKYGLFMNAVVSFVLIAGVVYFCLVLPSQYLMKKFMPPPPVEEPAPLKACGQCLSEVPAAATRCKFCTQPV